MYITFTEKNKNPTWPWDFRELNSIFLTLQISRIFSRVRICQLAFLFVIVLLFGFVPGKVVVATSFKTKKRPAHWTSFHYSQSFYLPCTDIIRNFADLLTLQLDKKHQFSSYSSNFDQFSAVILTSFMSNYPPYFETSSYSSIKENCFVFFGL